MVIWFYNRNVSVNLLRNTDGHWSSFLQDVSAKGIWPIEKVPPRPYHTQSTRTHFVCPEALYFSSLLFKFVFLLFPSLIFGWRVCLLFFWPFTIFARELPFLWRPRDSGVGFLVNQQHKKGRLHLEQVYLNSIRIVRWLWKSGMVCEWEKKLKKNVKELDSESLERQNVGTQTSLIFHRFLLALLHPSFPLSLSSTLSCFQLSAILPPSLLSSASPWLTQSHSSRFNGSGGELGPLWRHIERYRVSSMFCVSL